MMFQVGPSDAVRRSVLLRDHPVTVDGDAEGVSTEVVHGVNLLSQTSPMHVFTEGHDREA